MNKIALVMMLFVGTAFSTQAFALHFFNCSNADGSVKIVEEEIWGANPVGCYYMGEVMQDATVVFDKKSIVVHEYRQEGPVPQLDWEKTYSGKATVNAKGLVAPVETFLICKEKSTSALDFAAPGKNCQVEYK